MGSFALSSQEYSSTMWMGLLNGRRHWPRFSYGLMRRQRGVATPRAFVTCGDWDLKTMMPQQCDFAGCHVPQRFRQWLNIKDLFSSVLGKKGSAMPAMLEALKLELRGHHHSGLDD